MISAAKTMALINRFQSVVAAGEHMRQTEACATCPLLDLLLRGIEQPRAEVVAGSLQAAAHAHIAKIISEENGNISSAARRLLLNRTTVYKYLDQMGVRRRRKRVS